MEVLTDTHIYGESKGYVHNYKSGYKSKNQDFIYTQEGFLLPKMSAIRKQINHLAEGCALLIIKCPPKMVITAL